MNLSTCWRSVVPDPATQDDDVAEPVKVSRAEQKVIKRCDLQFAKVLIEHYLEKRERVRVGRVIVAGGCIMLFSVAVVEKWVRPPSSGCDNFSTLLRSQEPLGEECSVRPHSLWSMSCAFAMLIAVKLISLKPSLVFGSTDAAQRAGLSGVLERLLAVWNCAAAFLICILTWDSSNQMLAAVPWRNSLVLTPFGWRPPLDATCAEFSSSEELQRAVQLCFGDLHAATVMAGATFMALGELMKLKCTDQLPARGFDVSGLLVHNRALERSEWLRELRRKSAQLLLVLEKARAVSTEPEPSPTPPMSRVNSRDELLQQAHPRTRSRQLLELREEATSYLRQMAHDCIRQPSERDLAQFVFEADLDQVCWPFALQAFAFALWLPLDLVQVDPCLNVNDAAWWRLDALLGVHRHRDVNFLLSLHVAALGAAALVAIVSTVWLILSGDPRLCKPRVSPPFWILVIFASVSCLLRPSHSRDEGLASSALRWLGLWPVDWRQVLLLSYAVQVVARLAIARGRCCDCCTPSVVELDVQDEQLSQARFEVFSVVAMASGYGTVSDQAALAGLGALNLDGGLPLENPFHRARRREGRFARAADEGACAPPQSLRLQLLRRAQRGYSFLPTLSRLNEGGDVPQSFSDDLSLTSV